MYKPGTGLRYHDIANQIRSHIVEGRYRLGDALPSQSALAQEFSTTVMTVRQAIRLLESEGLVESKHGVGSFVTGLTEDHRVLELAGFAQSIDSDRASLGTRILERVADAAPPSGSPNFPGSLSALVRIRTFKTVPIVYQTSYISREFWTLVRDLTPEDSLYTTLSRALNTVVSQARERISVRSIPPDVASLLTCSPGTPGLYSERTSMDAAGRAVLFDQAYMLGDSVHLSLIRNGRNGDFRYVVDLHGGEA